jgi:glutathione S-transferase
MPGPSTALLYSYRRCPYAMRARMALLVAQKPFQVFEIELKNKPAEMLALSPKGTVPVLRLPDGQVLEQSWDIMAWALAGAEPAHWWQGAQSAENQELLRCNDGEFKALLDRYKYPNRFALEGKTPEHHRDSGVSLMLEPLEQRLRQQGFLGGAQPCATDLAVFPFVRQFAAVDPVWWEDAPLPAVRAWLAAWVSSPLFLACMARPVANSEQ